MSSKARASHSVIRDPTFKNLNPRHLTTFRWRAVGIRQ